MQIVVRLLTCDLYQKIHTRRELIQSYASKRQLLVGNDTPFIWIAVDILHYSTFFDVRIQKIRFVNGLNSLTGRSLYFGSCVICIFSVDQSFSRSLFDRRKIVPESLSQFEFRAVTDLMYTVPFTSDKRKCKIRSC